MISVLGRLFRRSSSLSESDANPVPAAIPVMKPQQNQPNGQPEMVRRVSITEAVQAQFGTSPPAQQQIRPNPVIDHEFGIYTWKFQFPQKKSLILNA